MKTLSENNATLKSITLLLLSFFGALFSYIIFSKSDVLHYLFPFGIIAIGIFFTHRKYTYSYNFYYNDDYLILKRKRDQRNIALEKIKRVKLTLSAMRIMGFQFYEFQINFVNEKGAFETISFFVSNLNSLFWNFQDLVKLKSPDAKIENYVRSDED